MGHIPDSNSGIHLSLRARPAVRQKTSRNRNTFAPWPTTLQENYFTRFHPNVLSTTARVPTPTDIGIFTGDAQPLCSALCREATKEANSTEESTKSWTRAVSIGSRLSCRSTCLFLCPSCNKPFPEIF